MSCKMKMAFPKDGPSMNLKPDWEYPAPFRVDQWGPAKVLYLSDSYCGLKAIVVVDNVACGPALGGVRMLPDVTPEEVSRLARAMTLKNAAAGLAHGGAKAAILARPGSPERETLLRSFARGIAELREYIPAPDMGTDEECMAVIHREIGRAAGLPRSRGGIPLDEIGATGFGVAECSEVAAEFAGLRLKGARVAIEGFGHVGEHAASFLAGKGAVIVAVSDIHGLIHAADGLDLLELARAKREHGSVMGYSRACRKLPKEEIFSVHCDLFVPAARSDTLNAKRAATLRARLVVEGANIPATAEAERILHERGVVVVPDFIANAGGVICCSVEYRGGNEAQAFAEIRERLRRNTATILERARSEKRLPREVAERLALERVGEAARGRDSAFLVGCGLAEPGDRRWRKEGWA